MDREKLRQNRATTPTEVPLSKSLQEPRDEASELISKFEDIVKKIGQSGWKQAITEATHTYQLKNYNIQRLNPLKITDMYRSVAFKFYNSQKNKTTWHENELRIYMWLLLTYARMIKLQLQELTQQHWEFLAGFFMGKSPSLCQFQCRNLKKICGKSEPWLPEEDCLLESIIKSSRNHSKWNQIAKQIFSRSDHRFFRTAKQCRQRWNNYLDPKKNKGEWTVEQELSLIKCVIQKGKKWALIAKVMNNQRTEHMIKNRFKSIMAKHTKKIRRRQVREQDILLTIEKEYSLQIEKGQDDQKKQGGTQLSLQQEKKKDQTATTPLSPPTQSAFSRSFRSDSKVQDDRQKMSYPCLQIKSPSITLNYFSPMPPPTLTPGFSPFPDVNRGKIYYQSQKTPRHEINYIMPCNYFSFENLKKQ